MEEKIVSIFDIFEFEEIVVDKEAFDEKEAYQNASFDIKITDVVAGWAKFRIIFNGKEVCYSSSDCMGDNGLPAFLEAIVDILPLVGEKDKYFSTLRKHSRVIHNMEPTEYVWDFKREDMYDFNDEGYNVLQILLRKDPRLEHDGHKLCHYNYSLNEYLDDEPITEADLHDGVVLAIKIDTRLFVAKVYIACIELLDRIGAEKYKKEWRNEDFPFDMLEQIEQYIKIYLPWKWEFLKIPLESKYSTGYSIDYKIENKVKRRLIIRNHELASVELLKERGLLR